MTPRTKRSRKRALLLVVAIALLLLLSVLILRERPRFRPTTHYSENIPATISQRKAFFRRKTIANRPSPIADPISTAQKTDIAESSLIDSASDPPVTDGALISGEASAPFAVVDMKRILAARQSDMTSPESQSILLARIKRIISAHARSHRLEFVFDISDQTINGPSAFINPTNGALDLTEEVLKELSR